MAGPGVDHGHAPRFDDQVDGHQLWPHVHGIDGINTVLVSGHSLHQLHHSSFLVWLARQERARSLDCIRPLQAGKIHPEFAQLGRDHHRAIRLPGVSAEVGLMLGLRCVNGFCGP